MKQLEPPRPRLTLTLKMTIAAHFVEMSVTVNNSPIQDYVHPDDHAPSTYEMTPGFKPFTVLSSLLSQIARVLRSRRSARETRKILRRSLITPVVSRDSETKSFL